MQSSHSNAQAVQLFSDEECDRIVSLAQRVPASSAASPGAGRIRRLTQRLCKVTHFPQDADNKWIYDRLRDKAMELNDEVWKFELDSVETLQFVSYGFLNHFARHMDSGVPKFSQRKLTVSVQLSRSSDYGGGSLYVWSRNKDRTAPRTRGAAMFFPSHLWHRANPILWGRRLALVGWLKGKHALR
ncbi:2OG-Fe(II) oxygenase [Anderseniella sp. Alg231-50]|uniref:2OG-Fe(II) oxygenase n=1 Tax=Anderseniella sp. Alg231-50 TaxID=1922226 RepID=UPI000D54FBCE